MGIFYTLTSTSSTGTGTAIIIIVLCILNISKSTDSRHAGGIGVQNKEANSKPDISKDDYQLHLICTELIDDEGIKNKLNCTRVITLQKQISPPNFNHLPKILSAILKKYKQFKFSMEVVAGGESGGVKEMENKDEEEHHVTPVTVPILAEYRSQMSDSNGMPGTLTARNHEEEVAANAPIEKEYIFFG